MASMTVTTDTLDDAANNLVGLRTQLESLRQIPSSDAGALGGTSAYAAFQGFSDAWSYGVTQIDTSVEELATALHDASTVYKDGEVKLTTAFTHGGFSTTKAGAGAATGSAAAGRPSSKTNAHEKSIAATVNKITDPRIKDNPDLKAFIESMAVTTGLSPLVIAAWTIQEGGSSYGGRYNYLNIGNTNDATYGAGDSIWDNPSEAGKITGEWLEGEDVVPGYGTASAGVQSIAQTKDKSPEAQIAAIQSSGWATSGEPLLNELYREYAAQVG